MPFPLSTNGLLLADFGDIVSALIPVVVFIIWVIGQIANRGKAAQPPQRPLRPMPKPAAADAAAPDGQTSVYDEIETFLARARQQIQPPASPKQPVEAIVVPEKRTVKTAARKPQNGGRQSVDDYVRQHMSTVAMDRHVDELGDAVEVADDRMEAHMQEKFQHRLGALDRTSQTPEAIAAAASSTAVTEKSIDFAALLADGDDVKRAIVVNEILQRPAARW
jgi:hypothetical protein